MARACVGRPDIVIVKTPIHINEPILNCDTCSNADGIRILEFLEKLAKEKGVVIAARCDGAAMLTCAAQAIEPARPLRPCLNTAHSP